MRRGSTFSNFDEPVAIPLPVSRRQFSQGCSRNLEDSVGLAGYQSPSRFGCPWRRSRKTVVGRRGPRDCIYRSLIN